jgi:carbamoyl-phosphate synthase large subunit
VSDKLYFEELTFERIADICEFENPYGVIISVGGQTPNNRAKSLTKYGFNILGTSAENIEKAENRNKFSNLLDKLSIDQPSWNKFTKLEDAIDFAKRVGFPVLARPSFVLSGSNMKICHTQEDILNYAKNALEVSKDYPITVSKFIEGAKEIEVDSIAQKGIIKAFVISDHIENAGVHSGDASISFPPQELYVETLRRLRTIAAKIAKKLEITGPFNIQAIAKENKVFVIEVNLRASRTFPFISKVTGVDFIGMFVDSLFEKNIVGAQIDFTQYPFVASKVAQFSFARIKGADPVLDVEMASTGEVACFGDDLEEAFLKGMLSVGAVLPKKGIFISLGGTANKLKFAASLPNISKIGLPIYATAKTSRFLRKNGIKTTKLYKIHEKKIPNVLEIFQQKKVDLAINLTDQNYKKDINDDYEIRRSAVDHNIPLFTNEKKAELFLRAFSMYKLEDLMVKEWSEYAKAG